MERGLILWIFGICALMAALLVAIGLAETAPNAAGLPHPRLPGMLAGGDGAARLEHIGALAFAFHGLLLLLICSLCVLGIAERRRGRALLALMAGSCAFMLLVCWRMHAEHQAFLATGETGYFLGFPAATAWQVYGTWLGAVPPALIWTLGFRRFVFSAEDEARFERLLAARDRRP